VLSRAIETGTVLIFIETLDNAEDIQAVPLPGLVHYGYSGHNIATVIDS